MQVSESWLRQYCNPPLSTRELADTLTMAGLEVEGMQAVAPHFSGVVVGQIVAIQPHPDADRLKVCSVDVGKSSLLCVVCGAPNIYIGMRTPCATVGAQLPNPDSEISLQIKAGMLRGIVSEGMLCSAKELGLNTDQTGLMELSSDAPLGVNLRTYLDLDDTILTLKLTPNLAHCLSIFGVARELSALTSAPLVQPDMNPVAPVHFDKLPVIVLAPDLCGRFSGRIIRNIDLSRKTPDWLRERLARCGQRSVNPLVDISNYVMFEMGQPTHIFDLDKLNGNLTVRWSNGGEQVKLLNGETICLDSSIGVIADDSSVESLAGIMGGDATSVSDETCNVYVEAAFWWPSSVAGRSRRFNFSTEAGYRFERGVDPCKTVSSIERITQLILNVCGGEAGVVDDHLINMPTPQSVKLRIARAERVVGMPLPLATCANALRSLGLHVMEGIGELTVVPPSYRFDIQIEEDLIEEIVRVVGYDRLPDLPPCAPIIAKLPLEKNRSSFAVRRTMAALGYQETINFSFVDERWEFEVSGNSQPIRLLNPIAKHMGVMRSSLLASLLNTARYNLDRKIDRIAIFEIGRIFLRNELMQDTDTSVAGFDQPQRLAGLVCGSSFPLHWDGARSNFDFFDLKGHVESLLAPKALIFETDDHPAFHPGRCAHVRLNERKIGYLGELHPKLRQSWNFAVSPLMFEIDLDAIGERFVPSYTPFSKRQPIERDFAVWVSESITHDQLISAIKFAIPSNLLNAVVLFDIYRKISPIQDMKLEKSMAFRLTFHQSCENSVEHEVDGLVALLVLHLEKTLGARLRA